MELACFLFLSLASNTWMPPRRYNQARYLAWSDRIAFTRRGWSFRRERSGLAAQVSPDSSCAMAEEAASAGVAWKIEPVAFFGASAGFGCLSAPTAAGGALAFQATAVRGATD
jgi:hypothetical protein